MKNIPTFEEFLNESEINETMKIISKEFGGYDDQEFLEKIWNLSLDELESLLTTAKSELKRHTSSSPKRGVFSTFARQDTLVAKGHIKFLESVIMKKKKDPSFVPDLYK